MMQLIAPEHYGEFSQDLQSMHRLRYRVFRERLDWDVQVSGDLELDTFDVLDPHYLLLRNCDGSIGGCVRLLPSSGPTMLRDTFPSLLGGQPAPEEEDIWESSRFALDLPPTAPKGAVGIAVGTYELFAAMIEFGRSRNLRRIVTVTDMRMERILRRAGWPLVRLGEPEMIGNTRALAGFLDISEESLMTIRQNGGLNGPVLWEPVLSKTAA